MNNRDIDFEIINQRSNKSGECRLWLRVLLNAVYQYLYCDKFSQKSAEGFLFDDNIFFDMVADSIGYEPDALRQRIRKAKRRCSS